MVAALRVCDTSLASAAYPPTPDQIDTCIPRVAPTWPTCPYILSDLKCQAGARPCIRSVGLCSAGLQARPSWRLSLRSKRECWAPNEAATYRTRGPRAVDARWTFLSDRTVRTSALLAAGLLDSVFAPLAVSLAPTLRSGARAQRSGRLSRPFCGVLCRYCWPVGTYVSAALYWLGIALQS